MNGITGTTEVTLDVTRTTSTGSPRIIDPGGDGWADEPKGITDAERLLYGDMAGPVRLLGSAAVDAERAYSLACKHASEGQGWHTEDDAAKYREFVDHAYGVYRQATVAYREVAASAAALMREWWRRGEEPTGEVAAKPQVPTKDRREDLGLAGVDPIVTVCPPLLDDAIRVLGTREAIRVSSEAGGWKLGSRGQVRTEPLTEATLMGAVKEEAGTGWAL